MPLLCAFLAVALLAFMLHLIARARQRELLALRPASTYEEYQSAFRLEDVSPCIVDCTYAYLSRRLARNGQPFPVLANDLLYDVYGIDEEELEDMISDILSQCHRLPAPGSSEPRNPRECVWIGSVNIVGQRDFAPVRTVKDLVTYLSRFPPIESATP
jgi:hypothetical protein